MSVSFRTHLEHFKISLLVNVRCPLFNLDDSFFSNISRRSRTFPSQCGETDSNFPHRCSRLCLRRPFFLFFWGGVQGPCTLNGVNYTNETCCIQIMLFVCQTHKSRCSGWGWNNKNVLSGNQAPGAGYREATTSTTGAEQFPLVNGSLPTSRPSAPMKHPLLHSF